MPSDPVRLALLVAPLFLIGAGAGALGGLALRRAPGPTRRRLTAGWILTLLCGAPLWLIAAAVLRLW